MNKSDAFKQPSRKSRPIPSSEAVTVPPQSQQETRPPRDGTVGDTHHRTIPKRLGRYHIERVLGQGGMGTVYLATDTKLQRPVALKIPKVDRQTDAKLFEQILREARSAATLDHPNICSIYDVGVEDGVPYISMAYISGITLSELVGTPRLRSERAIAWLVRKVALALAAAHKAGVLHRDLKSGNILVDARNEPIVTDFGLACRVERDQTQRTAQHGELGGTPAYMAPEKRKKFMPN